MQNFLKFFYNTTFNTKNIFDAINKIFFTMEYFLEYFKI